MTTIDLVSIKSKDLRIAMRNNMLAYKITKGDKSFISTYKDISKLVDYKNMNVSSASLYRGHINGWVLERVGLYKKVFELYEDDKLIFNGFVEDVASKLSTTELRVAQLCNHDLLAMGKYKVRFDGKFELVEMRV